LFGFTYLFWVFTELLHDHGSLFLRLEEPLLLVLFVLPVNHLLNLLFRDDLGQDDLVLDVHLVHGLAGLLGVSVADEGDEAVALSFAREHVPRQFDVIDLSEGGEPLQ